MATNRRMPLTSGGGDITPVQVIPRQGNGSGNGWGDFTRWAGELPLQAMQTAGLVKDGNLRWGRVGGIATLLALLGAAGELNDPNESTTRNVSQAAGSGLGGLGGSLGGAMIGARGGPVGALIGATLGGVLGSPVGRGLGNAVAGVAEGSPADQALRQAQKQARAGMELEKERYEQMLPLQQAAADMALQNEIKAQTELSKLASDRLLRENMAQAFLMQQQYSGAQQLAATQAILGGLL